MYPAHPRVEGKSEIVATNQSHVNKPDDQWEPGGKDTILMPTPPPHLESCLREQEREVEEGGEGEGGGGGQVKRTQNTADQRKKP